ncbi:MAG: hypothetical protein QM820_47575 [Minicystis sp.]
MLPFHLPMWETDATLRASIQETVQASVAPFSMTALLSGLEIAGDARATGPRSVFTAEARAHYARALDLTGGAPEHDVDGDASATAAWTLSPLSSLELTTEGSLATTFGVRADSLLLVSDPFSDTPRLEYGVGADLAFAWQLTPRGELAIDGGFLQNGALAAWGTPDEQCKAVGLDSREFHGGISYSYDLGARTAITPEIRWVGTHYDKALFGFTAIPSPTPLPTARGPLPGYIYRADRGRADVQTISFNLGVSREIRPETFVSAGAGLTAGSPMPILKADGPLLAPEASLGLRWRGRRTQLTARYVWSYSSLGPRVGYGQQHTVTLRMTSWPFRSARGAVLRTTVRAGYGTTPVGVEEPPAPASPVAGMPMMGYVPPTWRGLGTPSALLDTSRRSITQSLSTAKIMGRFALEIPVAKGWAVTTGIDLTAARGWTTGQSALPLPANQVITGMLTLGLAATMSTDPRQLYPRNPGSDEDVARRREGLPGAVQRTEDRTRIDEGREARDEEIEERAREAREQERERAREARERQQEKEREEREEEEKAREKKAPEEK